MIIVDSSVWDDYFRGVDSPQTAYLDTLFGNKKLAAGDLILAEVLQGFAVKTQFDEALDLFRTMPVYRLGGVEVAIGAARSFQTLRTRGYTIRKTIDTLIATFCIRNGHQLLHNDRDFLPFEEHLGLKCVAC